MFLKKTILLTSFVLLLLACGNSPEASSIDFTTAYFEGDIEKMCELSSTYSNVLGAMTMSEAKEEYPPQPEFEIEVLSTEVTVNGNNATVEIIVYNDVDTVEVEVACRSVEGEWTVNELTVSQSYRLNQYLCSSWVKALAWSESYYFQEHGVFTTNLSLTLGSEGYRLCPQCDEEYEISVSGDSFSIKCPYGHDGIENGIYPACPVSNIADWFVTRDVWDGWNASEILELCCQRNMSTLYSLQKDYHSEHYHTYAEDLSELGQPELIYCPECEDEYDIVVIGQSFEISCPQGHGTIDEDFNASWY